MPACFIIQVIGSWLVAMPVTTSVPNSIAIIGLILIFVLVVAFVRVVLWILGCLVIVLLRHDGSQVLGNGFS